MTLHLDSDLMVATFLAHKTEASAVVTSLLAVLLVYLIWGRGKKKPSLPPGPKGLPVLGNAHQLPKVKEHLTWRKWGQDYGPIVYASAFGTPLIILNSNKIATDLLERRGENYSGRPHMNFGGDLVGVDRQVAFMSPGPDLREAKKMFRRTVEARRAHQYTDLLESEARKFAVSLYEDPAEFREYTRLFSEAIIFSAIYGYAVDRRPFQDPYVRMAEKFMSDVAVIAAPGVWLIDILPILKYVPAWFPGGGFRKQAAEYRKSVDRYIEEPYNTAIEAMKTGSAPVSCISMLINDFDCPVENRDELIKWTASTLISGGSYTTISATSSFFLAMSLHPEIQQKARKELDSVVGPDRLPRLMDRPKLPYIEAIMNEVVRFAPPIPSGLPHESAKDDVYDGYFIPKGSIVWQNIWGMCHDPNIFNNPEEFNPDRFLPGSSSYKQHPFEPKYIIFGYGRRVCPGKELGQMEMWIAMATALHLFDITPPPGGGVGKSFSELQMDYTDGLLVQPPQFKVTIKPRSEKAEGLLRGL